MSLVFSGLFLLLVCYKREGQQNYKKRPFAPPNFLRKPDDWRLQLDGAKGGKFPQLEARSWILQIYLLDLLPLLMDSQYEVDHLSRRIMNLALE